MVKIHNPYPVTHTDYELGNTAVHFVCIYFLETRVYLDRSREAKRHSVWESFLGGLC